MSKELATTAGRGRKLCPSCNKYPGVRSRVCLCGYEFGTKVAPKKLQIRVATKEVVRTESKPKTQPEIEAQEESRYPSVTGTVVIIPSGVPPVSLDGTSIEVVRQWMIDVRKSYSDGYLTHEALCYWVRYAYPFCSSDKDGKCVIDNTGDLVRAMIREIDGVINNNEVKYVSE